MKIFDELKARGFIAQCTDEEKVADLLNNDRITFYTGFDPTADSLTAGHFLQLVVMSHLQRAGHRPIVLLGGGTTMVGDPTGKSDMRKMLTKDEIAANAERFKSQMSTIMDFSEDGAVMVNNADWLLNLNYVDFLRDVGVHYSVNRMLAAECFKSRMERGLTFLEFNYMLMQGYDFYKLFTDYGCVLQLGGDDQWSNILGGEDLIRRKTGKEAYGLTFTLLTTSDGRKMGKTEKGAVWLDPNKTSPFDFYQYWRNVDDADVVRFMKLLTFLPLSEIAEYEKMQGSELNALKEKLAYEITKTVHGTKEADKAMTAARALFSGNADNADMPCTMLSDADFDADGRITVAELLVSCGLCASRSDARRIIEQGGAELDGEKIGDARMPLEKATFAGGRVIKKGKKIYHKAMLP